MNTNFNENFLCDTESNAINSIINANFNFEFNFYLKSTGKNSRYNSKIYAVYLNTSGDDYFLFGKCYIRKQTFNGKVKPIEVFPILSSYYERSNNLEEVVAKKIAEEMAILLCSYKN